MRTQWSLLETLESELQEFCTTYNKEKNRPVDTKLELEEFTEGFQNHIEKKTGKPCKSFEEFASEHSYLLDKEI